MLKQRDRVLDIVDKRKLPRIFQKCFSNYMNSIMITMQPAGSEVHKNRKRKMAICFSLLEEQHEVTCKLLAGLPRT